MILVFGDSVAQGIVVQNGRYRKCDTRFTTLLENSTDCKIENYAFIGHTIKQLPQMLERHADTLFVPENDTVILQYGGNDCDFDWKQISETPLSRHECKTEIDTFIADYKKHILYLTRLGKRVIVLSLPPIDPYRYLDTVSAKNNKDNILVWLENDREFIRNWHERYNISVIRLAHECGVEIVDITSPFLCRKNYNELLCIDGIHPNAVGHRLIAETIYPILKCQ